MEKLWAGRFKSALDGAADDFNASIRVDARMYREDIEGSQAHVRMLGACGIVTEAEAERILRALGEIRAELDDGRLEIDPACEDIHSFVEKTLTARIGDTGKKLHTARSRNDQVAVDTRLYLRRMADEEKEALLRLVRTLVALAKAHTETILPGYTHLQRAQPISFAQQLLAYQPLPAGRGGAGRHDLPHRPRADGPPAGLRRRLREQHRRRLRPRLRHRAGVRQRDDRYAYLAAGRGGDALGVL